MIFRSIVFVRRTRTSHSVKWTTTATRANLQEHGHPMNTVHQHGDLGKHEKQTAVIGSVRQTVEKSNNSYLYCLIFDRSHTLVVGPMTMIIHPRMLGLADTSSTVSLN